MELWMGIWTQLDFGGLPGYEGKARALFRLLGTNLPQLSDLFCQVRYSH
jgi:hypothetical protein